MVECKYGMMVMELAVCNVWMESGTPNGGLNAT